MAQTWLPLPHLRRQLQRFRKPSTNKKSQGHSTGGGLWAAVFVALGLGAPAFAQVTPFAEVSGYNVAQVEDSAVCFAAIQLPSENGDEMLYTYYQAQAGQRWHVAGYVESVFSVESVVVNLSVDGVETLSRETETRDGDFMFPFETLVEIQGHETLVETGDTMVIKVGDTDSLAVPLWDYRAALAAVQSCLKQV